MRVVGVTEFGGPESLQVLEVPDPHATAGKVRIRVKAAAVNPTDTYSVNGARAEQQRVDPPPYVPGMDAAGIVDEVGEGVSGVAVGDEVMAIVIPRGTHGGYAELLSISAQSIAPIPTGTSFAEASTLPMNGLTAQLTLDLLSLTPGSTLAVTGAAGAYGGYVVQLAKDAGLTVIADASEADEAPVRSLGADHVVRRGVDVADAIRAIVPGGVDALADGSVQGLQVVPAIRDGGQFATVRGFSEELPRGIALRPVWVRDYAKAQEKLARLGALVNSGAVTLRVAKTFTPEQAADAHRQLMAGGTRGRLVIEF